MSFGVNKLILVGRVSQDPEFRQYAGGTIAILSIATSEKRKDNKSGQWIEETEFHNGVTFFGKTAEIIQQYVVKGTAVYVEGKLKTESYTDKQGQQKKAQKIMGVNLQMLGKAEGQQQGQGQQQYNQGQQHGGYNNQQRQQPPQNNQYQQQSQGYHRPPPQQQQGYQQQQGQPPQQQNEDFYDDTIPF